MKPPSPSPPPSPPPSPTLPPYPPGHAPLPPPSLPPEAPPPLPSSPSFLAIEGGGGAIFLTGGTLLVTDTTFRDVSAPHAGAVGVSGGRASFERCEFLGNRATDGDGGALLISGGVVDVSRSVFAENAATGSGGAIRMAGGALELSDHTTVVNNHASSGRGKSFFIEEASQLTYQLPAPLGHYVLAPEWDAGRTYERVPSGALDSAYPYACPLGFVGATDSLLSPLDQSSHQCSGLCPAQFFCPGGTHTPTLCTRGHYCPVGSGRGIPCPAGTFSNATGLASVGGCRRCPTPGGHYCAAGSVEPLICPSGSYAPDGTGARPCVFCTAGKFQSATGAFGCHSCPAGAWCPLAATTPLQCPAGTYNRGELQRSVRACLPVEPGFWSPTGSASPLRCPESGTTHARAQPPPRHLHLHIMHSPCAPVDSSRSLITVWSLLCCVHRLLLPWPTRRF